MTLDIAPPSRYYPAVPETLRDVAVATMILSQVTLGITAAAAGNYREAAIGTLCAVVNTLIFWVK